MRTRGAVYRWVRSPRLPRNSCENVNTAETPPLCDQGKGIELLLGLMDYFIDGLLFVSAMHDFFFLCFSSTLAIPVPMAAAACVLDTFLELCPS